MKRKLILAAFLCAATFLGKAQSVDFLEAQPDARTAALAGVGSSLSADAWSIYWGAAKATNLSEKMAVAYSFTPWTLDKNSSNAMHRVGGAFRLGKGAIVAGYRLAQLGEFEERDNSGNYIGDFKPYNYTIEVGYAYPILKGLSVGAVIRYIHSDFQQVNMDAAKAVGVDASLYYLTACNILGKASSLSVALNVANMGNQMKYEEDKYAQPTNVNLGVALTVPFSINHTLTAALEGRYLLMPSDNANFNGGIGFEYSAYKLVHVRAGYHFGDIEKTTGDFIGLGAGVDIKGISVDFAYRVAMEEADLTDKQMCFTLGYKF